ncbi:uncharacterized protein PFL1_03843 [Pseudozyma flocculosa PF-1]|uniref:Uncharacterized protein n=2 Tax=Pseudozyma flocculosa TaxID=84751 RepID=A0A5C3EW10_9BASI|nr:uncharacterized protein PFL1_03843 [Pseudozyma flocculosa PF-1]EPQ28539.1 hypothetical protein PFL1_03843 [Pseudozyma flocculosa PF-1]SPO36463.1 uncharacterized protein PSFLO_01934 [Pseudozyma flocculosa]
MNAAVQIGGPSRITLEDLMSSSGRSRVTTDGAASTNTAARARRRRGRRQQHATVVPSDQTPGDGLMSLMTRTSHPCAAPPTIESQRRKRQESRVASHQRWPTARGARSGSGIGRGVFSFAEMVRPPEQDPHPPAAAAAAATAAIDDDRLPHLLHR